MGGRGARACRLGGSGSVKHDAHVPHACALLHPFWRDQLALGVRIEQVDCPPAYAVLTRSVICEGGRTALRNSQPAVGAVPTDDRRTRCALPIIRQCRGAVAEPGPAPATGWTHEHPVKPEGKTAANASDSATARKQSVAQNVRSTAFLQDLYCSA